MHNLSFRIIILLIASCITLTCYADPQEKSAPADDKELDKFEEMEKEISALIADRDPTKLLLLVTMDRLLLAPTDEGFYIANQDQHPIMKRALSAVRESKMVFFDEVILTGYNHKAPEPRLNKMIGKYLKQGIPTIIMTRNVSGKFNKIPYLEQWTVDFLKKYDIDLEKGAFGEARIILDKYFKKAGGSYPTFYKGLISSSYHRGNNAMQTVLSTALIRLGYKPDAVIFISDKKKLIDATGEQLKGILGQFMYAGYHFEPQKPAPSKTSPENVQIFWQKFAKSLNSVSRGKNDSDEGNPYE